MKTHYLEPNNGEKMSRFNVDIEIVNYTDVVMSERGLLDRAKVRRLTIPGIVDSGAAMMVLPLAVVKKLGLHVKKDKIKVKYADGRRGTRSEAGPIEVHLLGRDAVFLAVVEPKRETALIGALVLETLDFLVDSRKERLVPRDPDSVFCEIE
ncbi:MAG: hypothetical protein HY289_11565 [Planctomycetes bacterium]|nr:hypothetical protein [Planctomycetota bacterium]